jgi:GNAT superfamily N-acetyltransferase
MQITLSEQIPERNTYFRLFENTGWNAEYHVTAEQLEKVNRDSWLTLAAYDGTRLVGFGRVVTDHLLHAMIFDLIIDPGYQLHGIGTQILNELVQRCQAAGIHDIQLFCAKGKRVFYEKNGFVARTEDAPGMQYKKD